MPFTFNGIGTTVCPARVHRGGDCDSVVCFVIFHLPLVPLDTVHTFDWQGMRYRQIPLRSSTDLVLRAFARRWLFVLLVIGLACMAAGTQDALAGRFAMASFGLLLMICGGGAMYGLRASDQRNRDIRDVLGLHEYGRSDPALWGDPLLQAVRRPDEMYGASRFADAVQPLLASGDFCRAMWAARLSTALEDRWDGEQLTDIVLNDLRVNDAIVQVRHAPDRFKEIMYRTGMGQPEAPKLQQKPADETAEPLWVLPADGDVPEAKLRRTADAPVWPAVDSGSAAPLMRAREIANAVAPIEDRFQPQPMRGPTNEPVLLEVVTNPPVIASKRDGPLARQMASSTTFVLILSGVLAGLLLLGCGALGVFWLVLSPREVVPVVDKAPRAAVQKREEAHPVVVPPPEKPGPAPIIDPPLPPPPVGKPRPAPITKPPLPPPAAKPIQPAQLTGEGISKDWNVIFRSDDPTLWDQDVDRDASHFALALSNVPNDIGYLRVRKDAEFVIMAMSRERLTVLKAEGRYGWNGTNQYDSGAKHLGIYDSQMSAKGRGDICIRVIPWQRGWGFGHIHFVNGRQGYCWDGQAIDPTVFEIAVKSGELTEAEGTKLLK